MTDYSALRALAQEATPGPCQTNCRFIAAANPVVVLGLLDELDAVNSRIEAQAFIKERASSPWLRQMFEMRDELAARDVEIERLCVLVELIIAQHPKCCPASQHAEGRKRWVYCSDDQCQNSDHDRLVDCYYQNWHDMDDAIKVLSRT